MEGLTEQRSTYKIVVLMQHVQEKRDKNRMR